MNDHVLKQACPSALTGKLSDVASLAFFPLLPIAAREIVLARRGTTVNPSHTWSLAWIAATGLVMASINTIELAADAYRWGLGLAQWPIRALLAGAPAVFGAMARGIAARAAVVPLAPPRA